MSDQTAEDALAIAQRALAKVNDLEQECNDLKDRVIELELLVEEFEGRPYQQLSTDVKVGMVREYAYKKAKNRSTGHAAIDYDDVMWGVFDGEPGVKHCYTLLQKAASVDGMEYNEGGEKNNHLAVDVDRVKRESGLFPENKTGSEGVAQ